MRTLRALALAVVIGGIYALGALLTFWYLSAPETGVAFFPPAGLTIAVLLLTPRRSWPLWLAAVAVAEIWIDLAHGQTILMAAGFATANVVEPLIGASLFLMATKRHGLAPRRDLVTYIACAVAVGPFVGSYEFVREEHHRQATAA